MNSTQKQEINRRRQIVSRLRHEGIRTQNDIVQHLLDDYGIAVTQATVSGDLKALDHLWRQSALDNIDKWKQETLKQYRYLYQQSLAAWEMSLEDAEEITVDLETEIGDVATKPVSKRKIKGQSGNPAHLRNAQEALKAIRDLLGLDTAPGSSLESPIYLSITEWQQKRQERLNQVEANE